MENNVTSKTTNCGRTSVVAVACWIKINASLAEFSHVSGDESLPEEFMLKSDEVDVDDKELKMSRKNADLDGKLNELFGREKKVWILRELLSEEKEMRFMLKFLSLVVLCLDEKSEDHSKGISSLPVMVKLWIFVKNCENM